MTMRPPYMTCLAALSVFIGRLVRYYLVALIGNIFIGFESFTIIMWIVILIAFLIPFLKKKTLFKKFLN